MIWLTSAQEHTATEAGATAIDIRGEVVYNSLKKRSFSMDAIFFKKLAVVFVAAILLVVIISCPKFLNTAEYDAAYINRFSENSRYVEVDRAKVVGDRVTIWTRDGDVYYTSLDNVVFVKDSK